MNVGLYQAISGMKSNWENQQTLAANISRSNVPGNRAESVAFEVDTNQPFVNASELTSMGMTSAPITPRPWINFQQGSVEPTSNPCHLAVQGESFFSVRQKDGTVTYTRNGEFSRTQEGKLVLDDGAELTLEGNAPLVVENNAEVTVSDDGTVTVGGNSMGKLALVRFENPSQDLHQAEGGRFQLNAGHRLINGAGNDDRVMQGYLERSNIDSIRQMVDMMTVMRAYEVNQKMATIQDDTTGRLIQMVSGR